jgi:hypothetical protein
MITFSDWIIKYSELYSTTPPPAATPSPNTPATQNPSGGFTQEDNVLSQIYQQNKSNPQMKTTLDTLYKKWKPQLFQKLTGVPASQPYPNTPNQPLGTV